MHHCIVALIYQFV